MELAWISYEQVAAFLLGEFAREFGLEYVEEKQRITGLRTGTTWQVDGKGVKEHGAGFVIVECRRHTTLKQSQERVAALAYRIDDTGAAGGIIVSPLGLQEGAKRVAAAANIISVQLNQNCNNREFVLAFLEKVMIGAQDAFLIVDDVRIELSGWAEKETGNG